MTGVLEARPGRRRRCPDPETMAGVVPRVHTQGLQSLSDPAHEERFQQWRSIPAHEEWSGRRSPLRLAYSRRGHRTNGHPHQLVTLRPFLTTVGGLVHCHITPGQMYPFVKCRRHRCRDLSGLYKTEKTHYGRRPQQQAVVPFLASSGGAVAHLSWRPGPAGCSLRSGDVCPTVRCRGSLDPGPLPPAPASNGTSPPLASVTAGPDSVWHGLFEMFPERMSVEPSRTRAYHAD
jgi:hypothetical protein